MEGKDDSRRRSPLGFKSLSQAVARFLEPRYVKDTEKILHTSFRTTVGTTNSGINNKIDGKTFTPICNYVLVNKMSLFV